MEANGEVTDLVAKSVWLGCMCRPYVQKAAGCGSCTQPQGAIKRITIPIYSRGQEKCNLQLHCII